MSLGYEAPNGKPCMSDKPTSLTLLPPPEGYAVWLADLKTRIHTA